MADLTTTAAVKAYAGISGSGDDTAIDGIVSAVSELIGNAIGNNYPGGSVTDELHFAPASGAIVLRYPAASLTSVAVSGTALAAGDYELVDSRLIFRLANGARTDWTQGARITATYTRESTVPTDLELAAREACAFVVKQTGLDSGGSRLGLGAQSNADTGTADYFTQALATLPVLRMTLARYKVYA